MKKQYLHLYPHDSLFRKTEPVTLDYFQTDEFRFLVSEMFRIMYYRGGIGLAAPQIGWNRSVIIANTKGRARHDEHGWIFINPEIGDRSGAQLGEEGCLSIPGLYLPVERHDKIEVRSFLATGEHRVMEHKGLLSRVIQHEVDHLDGKTMLDRVSPKEIAKVDRQLASHLKEVKKKRSKREHELRQWERIKKKKLKSRQKAKANRKKRKKK